MQLPPKIADMVKEYLGQRALDIQAEQGRGAWVVTDQNGGSAAYIPVDKLPGIVGADPHNDFAQVLQMIDEYDPAREVVMIFNAADDLQFVGIVDAL